LIVAQMIRALGQKGGRVAAADEVAEASVSRDTWRMPPLDQLAPAKLSLAART
jgi:hypothetical protein